MSSSLGRALFGNKEQFKQLPTQINQQTQFLKNLLEQLGGGGGVGQNYQGANSYLSQMLSGSPEAYQNFAAPHINQFNEQVIPGLGERFAALGGGMGGGAGSSSGFAQALGGAASGLQSNLAGLYAGLQQQAAGQAFNNYSNLSNLGLGTRSFENVYQPGTGGLLGAIGSGFGQGLGQLGGSFGLSGLMSLLPKSSPAPQQQQNNGPSWFQSTFGGFG